MNDIRHASFARTQPVTVQRQRMVWDQIEGRGISDQEVLRAMTKTPRHLFVPEELRAMAYQDSPLSIGHRATISQPYMVALMTELLKPARQHRVLEIGTGSGYQTAILAQLAGEVFTIEIVPELAQSAAATLRELGYSNVTVRQDDGYGGWPGKAPFDGIIVTAAPLEVPEALIAQLSTGGRLVVPVGPMRDQDLIVIEKKAEGRLHRWSLGGVKFVPMNRAPTDRLD